jgi:anti-sigma regulatory factor (Ser/Thr protein kinase)
MSGSPVWSHHTRLGAEPVSAPRARAFVRQHLLEHQLAFLVDPVRLVVSELATNAVLHAQTAFTLTLTEIDQTVVLALQDDSTELPRLSSAAVSDIGGRGLGIVRAISLDWGISTTHSGSKTVWASFGTRTRQLI